MWVHPGSSKAEVTSFPPEPSTFYQEQHSSRSRFPILTGNGQHRRTAGTTQHGTGPPRSDPRAPSATSARPGRAEQQPRVRSPAHFSAPGTAEVPVTSSARRCPAWPGSARHVPTHLAGSARRGSAPRCLGHRRVTSLPAPPAASAIAPALKSKIKSSKESRFMFGTDFKNYLVKIVFTRTV